MTDLTELHGGFSLNTKDFKYKETSIHKEISLFLNDPQKSIYDAAVITEDEAFANLPKDHNFAATLERAD